MICNNNFCLSNQSRYQTISLPLKNLLLTPRHLATSNNSNNYLQQSGQHVKFNQLSSKSSLKSLSKNSSSNSTMVNTEDASRKYENMYLKKVNDKISISDLKKSQTLKKLAILSTTSSVDEIQMDWEQNSIIEKLQTIEIEGKNEQILNINTLSVNKTEIFLPQPKHFLLKWKHE